MTSHSPISPLFPSLLRPLAMKPSVPIDCRFRPYGCHARLSKENMEQHMVTATNVHLHLLLSKLTDLERSSRSMDRRVSELESRSGKKSSWSTTSLPAMLSTNILSKETSPTTTSLHAIPSIQSMSSLSSVSSEEEHASRKRRRDDEEEEMETDEDEEDEMEPESPSYGPHVHESLVQVASMAQAVQTAASIPPTWSTSPSSTRSRRDGPVSAAALRRRAARRLKRQRALLEGPNVPKKPKTAYNFFQSDSRKSIQQEVARTGPHLTREEKSQQVARVIGERWKALTEEQRIPYQKQADADKERYRAECEKHGQTAELDSPTTSGSESPVSPRSPVSPILGSAFHNASQTPHTA